MNNNKFTIISFYQFRQLKNLLLLKKFFVDYCSFQKLRGTILLAPEGINGVLAGLEHPIKLFEKKIISKGFNNLEFKYSYHKYMPFNRLKIKNKKEIITFAHIKLDVENNTATHVKAENWNNIIENKDTLLLDVRNEFEYKIGTFKNALNPKTKNFSDFKKFVDKELSLNKHKQIAMFCTGGIRCEKASSYMLRKGFKNLYQLKGGILQYLEKIQKNKSKWKGECFVFDNRVSVKNKLSIGTYELCFGCRMPISMEDRNSEKYEKGVSCIKCFNLLSNEKKERLRERNKQIKIAKKKGIYNPYIKYTPLNFL